MFRVAVKVLFFRQLYGLKHRWILTLISVMFPLVIVSLMHLSEASNPIGMNFTAVPTSWEIVVFPNDSDTRQLMARAQRILQFSFSNQSFLHPNVKFAKDMDEMKQVLASAQKPSVGVQFQVLTGNRLEYTLCPVTVPDSSNQSSKRFDRMLTSHLINDGVTSSTSIRLQAAIDAAYVKSHFPHLGNLQLHTFPDSSVQLIQSIFTCVSAIIGVSLGILIIAGVLGSYVTRDKMSGVRELLSINGIPRWMVSLSWLFSFGLLSCMIAVAEAVILKIPPSEPLIEHIDFIVLTTSLTLHGWTALVFVNFLANLLTSQVLTSIILGIYWLVTTVAAWLIGYELPKYFLAQGLLAFLPNVGLTIISSTSIELLWLGKELSVDNLFYPTERLIPAGYVVMIMLFSIIMFTLLSVYLDTVKPGPYGRARPWYLFQGKEVVTVTQPSDDPSTKPGSYFEKFSGKEPIGLECVNLVKIFGANKAVNSVSLKIIKNRITVLLGHNGAGKTTLFSILCGMYSPTSGSVYTDEYSIFEGNNIDKFRRVLGYCPQENLHINELTVQEHLVIFGMLKGLSRSTAKDFSDNWTKIFDMYEFRHRQAKKLSGGNKRKLSLAMAMTGKAQYLLLDEPSAGLDVESSRKLVDVLTLVRDHCTVFITTHNLDEADKLGDRIAIMGNGQVKCYGSTSFLKKKLETGYRLNCAVSGKDTRKVISAVKKQIGSAKVLYKTKQSVTFGLPPDITIRIPSLLRGLESKFGDNVSSTLSHSTLDDVFIKVQEAEGVKINVEELPTFPVGELKHSGCNLIELFKKRLKLMVSGRLAAAIILFIILPTLSTVLSMYTLTAFFKPHSAQGPREVKEASNDYQGSYALISSQHNDLSNLIRSALMKSGVPYRETGDDINTTLVSMAKKDLFEYRTKLLFAIDTQKPDSPKAYYSQSNEKYAALAYTALINAVIQGNATILTHNVPSGKPQNYNEDTESDCVVNPLYSEIAFLVFRFLLSPTLLLACVYFVVFPINERITLFKHLQLMTGLFPASYWLGNFLFDSLLFLSSCSLIIAIVLVMDFQFFLDPTVFCAFILVLVLYCISGIMFSYVWSFLVRSVTLSLILLIAAVIGLYWTLLMLEMNSTYLNSKYGYIFPWIILHSSFSILLDWAADKWHCKMCNQQISCDKLNQSPLFHSALHVEIICFVMTGIGYFLLLMFLDHGFGRKLMTVLRGVLCGKIVEEETDVDPEVAREKKRVNDLDTMDQDEQPRLVCNSLGKKYSCNNTAVYDVTFTAEHGECFGLVGVNGAGKSTTFGMLAALLVPTKGNATIEGQWEVSGCEYKYLKKLGYCPQFNALLPGLSARSIIRLFGRLHGVPEGQIKQLVDKWVNALDMTDIAKRPCGTYSGGNKRKLCIAIALLGNPSVVLLDEPTAGVDPVIRRKIWGILSNALQQLDYTVILTSHAMSECEAICDRLTIMVKGVMKCLGPVSRLKKTFAKSCSLEVTLSANISDEQLKSVQMKIESQFIGKINLDEKQQGYLKFTLATEKVKVHDIFASMLKIKSQNPIIVDFNLTETPLEQVFLMFAKNK